MKKPHPFGRDRCGGGLIRPGLADGHHPRPIVYNHTLSADKSLAVLARPRPSELQGSLSTRFGDRQLAPLLVTGGTRGNGNGRLMYSYPVPLETCCRGSQAVSLANQLPIIRRFSEMAIASIARGARALRQSTR